ncbi:MAG: 2-iminobutanoate/2-iminopropanoate deaminase [Gammaproteobacteria bacterium]|jgi:2-iminobutanoate/2-iminopropanoate deaminase
MTLRRDVVDLPDNLDLPRVLGAPASTAVRANGFLYTMGYMSLDPENGKVSPGSVEHETRLTMDGLRRIVELAGSSLDQVVKVHVFLADIDRDFEGMNRVYAEYFVAPYPARRTVQAKLVRDLKVEIEMIATC